MKVILLQDVPGTGKKNQVVNVSDGYARNYLLPRKWAKEASAASVKEIERRNEADRRAEAERRAEAKKLASALKGKTITVKAKCGEKGRLYGSVTGQELADALEQQHGVQIDKRKLEVGEVIRAVGDYEMNVTVYSGIKVPMKITIQPLE